MLPKSQVCLCDLQRLGIMAESPYRRTGYLVRGVRYKEKPDIFGWCPVAKAVSHEEERAAAQARNGSTMLEILVCARSSSVAFTCPRVA